VKVAALAAAGLTSGYGPEPVVHEIDLEVFPGEVVALLGPNGAGKTTTLLVLAGELKAHSGEVLVDGVPTQAQLHTRARAGLAYVTEERSVFMGLSARENLRVAGVSTQDVVALFPELAPRLAVPAGLLSGGEQQMLTLGRALCRKPRILLADELSLGLGPLVVSRLLEAVRADAEERATAVLVVEQHVQKALQYADRIYVMFRGRIALSGKAGEMAGRLDEIERTFAATRDGGLPRGGVS
jgi:branched-chain amino acid transport system ATP-binding protein